MFANEMMKLGCSRPLHVLSLRRWDEQSDFKKDQVRQFVKNGKGLIFM